MCVTWSSPPVPLPPPHLPISLIMHPHQLRRTTLVLAALRLQPSPCLIFLQNNFSHTHLCCTCCCWQTEQKVVESATLSSSHVALYAQPCRTLSCRALARTARTKLYYPELAWCRPHSSSLHSLYTPIRTFQDISFEKRRCWIVSALLA